MAIQSVETIPHETVTPSRPHGVMDGMHLVFGPLLPHRSLRYLLALYLPADGCAAWLLMQGRVMPALIVVLAARLIGWAIGRIVHVERAARPAAHASWLDALLYAFTIACIVYASRPDAGGPFLNTFPASSTLRASYAGAIDQAIGYLTVEADGFFRSLTALMLTLLAGLEALLANTPWPVIFAVVGIAGWRRGGWALLALCWVALGYLGLFGYWAESMQTISLVIASLFVCIVIGVPLGVLLAKSRTGLAVASPVLDLMQTMPSFVYLLPAVAFFSIGKPPALIATVIFSLPPLVRLTCLGIQQVPVYVLEAMQAHGATPLQTLFKAELPLALPSIRAGINQSIMMCLSMVVIAALIGGGGLGYNVLFALQNVQYGEGTLAGLAIVFCAVLFDRLLRTAKSKDHN